MKSAYELAMEKLEKQSPTSKLSERQKAEIAEIDSLYRAKIAEREVFLRDQIAKTTETGDAAAVAEIEQQLSSELRRLQEECKRKKEAVREKS